MKQQAPRIAFQKPVHRVYIQYVVILGSKYVNVLVNNEGTKFFVKQYVLDTKQAVPNVYFNKPA